MKKTQLEFNSSGQTLEDFVIPYNGRVSNLKVGYEVAKDVGSLVGGIIAAPFVIGFYGLTSAFLFPSTMAYHFRDEEKTGHSSDGPSFASLMFALGGCGGSAFMGFSENNEIARKIFYIGLATNIASGFVEYVRYKARIMNETPEEKLRKENEYQEWLKKHPTGIDRSDVAGFAD